VSGFQQLVARAGEAAGLGFPVHPHMLRHACGFKLANDGVDIHSRNYGVFLNENWKGLK
jgi:type 1 fimbriae regulatory protein FimB/type 1 fimbriae regulatory protein FimE